MLIQVTQENIDQAIRMSPHKSPVALAFARTLVNVDVMVGPPEVCINDVATYSLPFEAVNKELEFDAGKVIKPYSFDTGEKI